MTKQKSTKRALLMSGLALLMCVSMLIGSTFAWFTDSVTSSGNIIKSGTLDVTMEWADGKTDPTNTTWTDASAGPIFKSELWEPGYTEVRHIKIANEGTLALKYQLNILANGEVSELADVIDVYYLDPAEQLADRADIPAEKKLGTLSQVLEQISTTASGNLLAGEKHTITLALKMQESAGNKYQDLAIGSDFTIQLIATQFTYEEDSFDNLYDANANLDFTPVSSVNELKIALANKVENIVLTKNIETDEILVVDYVANIDGAGYTVSRANGFSGTMFSVKANASLTLEDVIVDGGAVWTGEVNKVLLRGTVNNGVTATGALVATEGNGNIVLNEGAVLQNNDGANAVSLNTRTGSKLTLNGGEIINNSSETGAIWGGGEIVLNSGKINSNYGEYGGAIRIVTNVGTVLTMNGGEMNNNYSVNNGGAIWAGSTKSNNVYVLTGGEMAYNYSEAAGGAMYAGYYETVKIGGTFKLHDNAAAFDGNAIRFHNHAEFVMTGGEIYDNGDNSLFLLNNAATITGGKISDTFGYGGGLWFTWGEAEIESVAFDLSTNHNTAYLAENFNTIKFIVNEADEHFANFNFKPADGYVYTEGDEDKLVCLNDGYSTYWDAENGIFRIKAN